MLEYLRDMSEKPIAKILIAVLAFYFVGWGVAEWIFSSTNRETTLVKVGDTNITVEQFTAQRAREISLLDREQQKQVYTDKQAADAFMGKVLSDMINETLVENRANDLKFVVTDKRLANEIRAFPEFQEDGAFSPRIFDIYLNNMAFTEAGFADYLRGQVVRSMVLGALSMPVMVPDFVTTAVYNARYSERQIEYVEVKFNDFKAGNPTEDQLREFYAKNPKTNPETRAVSYVLIPASMEKPDSYDAAYAIAQKVEDAIIGGESMKAAAEKNKAKFVALPEFSLNKVPSDKMLNDNMVARIFEMGEGLESEVMETKEGFLIVRVEKVTPAHTADFETAKKGLDKAWKIEEQRKHAYLHANELLVDLNKDGGSLKGKKSATVSRTKGAPMDVLVAAYAQAVGTNAIVNGQNSFYVLRVSKEIVAKPDTKKLADLRTEMQNVLTRDMIEDYSAFLNREYPTKVNKKTFDRVFAR